MLNKYPLWKYLLILAVLALGLLYSAPNLYPNDPAVQISGSTSSAQVTDEALQGAVQALTAAGIQVKSSQIKGREAEIRLRRLSDQMRAKELISKSLGGDYVAALNLLPTTPGWLRKIGATPMKLGLDLSGGVHFLLEVDMEKALDTRLGIYQNEIKAQLRKERIRYRSQPMEKGAIQLGFNSADDLQQARQLISGNFNDFNISESRRGDLQLLRLALTETKLNEIRNYALQQNLTTVRNRVNELGVSEPLVQRQGTNRIVVELPGVQDTAEAKRILGKTANLEFRLAAMPGDSRGGSERFEFREPGHPPAELEREVILTGDQVTDARASYDENGRPQVNIRLDSQGGDMISRATRNNVGRGMGVLFIEQRPTTKTVTQTVDGVEKQVKVQGFEEDRKIISLATIQSPLGNQFRITGLDGQGESSELALLLRAGGLAAPMYFAEERTLGPSLGAENIARGVLSTQWALIFVSLFVIFIYRFFGVLATLALAFNLILLVGLMSVIGATLTLPGIAGIVLTLGMAVDANVLIYSRIREELKRGLSVQRAIHEGFSRAFSAIVDSNLTTLLVGAILFALGTGPVKGFAVTLSLGILTSMFTAILVTRGMVNLIFGGRNFKKLWI